MGGVLDAVGMPFRDRLDLGVRTLRRHLLRGEDDGHFR